MEKLYFIFLYYYKLIFTNCNFYQLYFLPIAIFTNWDFCELYFTNCNFCELYFTNCNFYKLRFFAKFELSELFEVELWLRFWLLLAKICTIIATAIWFIIINWYIWFICIWFIIFGPFDYSSFIIPLIIPIWFFIIWIWFRFSSSNK